MPQLDISTFPSQLFWLFVSFLTLYGIMSSFVIPRISTFLVERTEAIDGKLKKASLLRQEAEILLNNYESILNDARVEARHRYMDVSNKVAKKVAKQQKEMIDSVNERLRVAEQGLLRARKGVIKELEPKVLDVAIDVLMKVTGQKYTKAELKKYQEKV